MITTIHITEPLTKSKLFLRIKKLLHSWYAVLNSRKDHHKGQYWTAIKKNVILPQILYFQNKLTPMNKELSSDKDMDYFKKQIEVFISSMDFSHLSE